MSQPPSNLPPGLSFARRTAPVKLPRLDFPRLGGPVESQPTRLGELAPDPSAGAVSSGEHVIAFSQPEAPPPTTTSTTDSLPTFHAAVPAMATAGAVPSSYTAFPTTTQPTTTQPTTPQFTTTQPTISTPPPFASAILRQGAPPTQPVPLGDPGPTNSVKEELLSMMTSSGATASIPDARDAAKVIVYGRSGSQACMRAIQDLMERQVSFQYVDVSRDSAAAAHLTAICSGEPVVPVIVYIGFGGV